MSVLERRSRYSHAPSGFSFTLWPSFGVRCFLKILHYITSPDVFHVQLYTLPLFVAVIDFFGQAAAANEKDVEIFTVPNRAPEQSNALASIRS